MITIIGMLVLCTLLTLCPQCSCHHGWVSNAVSLCNARRGRRRWPTTCKALGFQGWSHSSSVFKCIELEFTLEVASRENDSFNWLFLSSQTSQRPRNLCVSPLKRRQLALTVGLWIIPDVLKPTMICITSTHECSIRPWFSTVYPASPLICTWEDAKVAETQCSFRKHIMSILQRVVTNPAF